MMIPEEFLPADGSRPTALVTGAAKRIGAVLAESLAASGWHVVIHHHHSVDEARALADKIGGSTINGDLGDPDIGERLILACPTPPRLLVNNGGMFVEDGLADFGPDLFDRHMMVNLRGPALLTQAFARHLPEDATGMIVNLLDAKLSALNPDFFTYTLSKVGVGGLTEVSARALAPKIRVNAIAPTVTMVSGPQSRENFEEAHVYNPLKRGVEAEHIAAALQYLIQTPTVTGQTLTLDSGQRFLSMPRDVAYMVDK